MGTLLPASIDGFFARAMAKSPDDRPANGRELAELLAVALGERRVA